MEVWRVAIGNDCWSFSSFNSDDICVWVDWAGMTKENFAISFPKVVKNSDVCNFGIIVSKNVFSMLWNCFVNTNYFLLFLLKCSWIFFQWNLLRSMDLSDFKCHIFKMSTVVNIYSLSHFSLLFNYEFYIYISI